MRARSMERKKVLRLPRLRRYAVVAVNVLVVTLLLSALATQVVAADSHDEGESVFGQTCAACHTIGGGALVGPDLEGVTDRREGAWLKIQIQSPSVHQEQNDPISVANREEFGLPMPDLGLTDQQVDAVLAYLGTGEVAPSTLPGLFIPTLAAGVLTIVALTIFALRLGRKRVEIRP
jgi:mono/diheme cytochrome c family protein